MVSQLNFESIEGFLLKFENRIKIAELGLKNGIYDVAVSQMYYACFQSLSAYYELHEKVGLSHKHIKSIFNIDFCKNNKIDQYLCRFFNQALNDRIESDYDGTSEFEEWVVEENLTYAK